MRRFGIFDSQKNQVRLSARLMALHFINAQSFQQKTNYDSKASCLCQNGIFMLTSCLMYQNYTPKISYAEHYG